MTEETLEQVQETVSPEVGETAPLPQNSAGTLLRQARENSGFSVVEIARQLKLGARQIEALEEDDFDKLPGPTFVRGFIRNYAKLLQIDPSPILDAYLRTDPQSPAQVITAPEDQVSFSEHPKGFQIRYGIALAVAVAVAGAALYHWSPVKGAAPISDSVSKHTEITLPPPEENRPVPVAPVAAEPAAAMPQQQAAPPTTTPSEALPAVTLTFSGNSWVEIRDRQGKIVFSQLNPAGTQQTIQAAPPLELVIGNAPTVKLSYKGKPVDLTAFTRSDVARITLD
ncbi:MAG: helix-turn-helix domain-containing protein [Sulfuricellaceae bacterium]|jgi:cytoskeleton protein RodZ